MPRKPLIGITADLARDDRGSPRHQLRATYVESVARAGGIPVILPADGALREEALAAVDGVLITGGDDIDTRPFGVELHPMAKVMDPARQASEFALLRALDARPSVPVLGICLGMQLMGRHRGDAIHTVHTELGSGPVASWHHQALADAPGFEVIGHSDDGVIEAIRDRARPFFVGVQWHPERTPDQAMGDGVVRRFVESARPK